LKTVKTAKFYREAILKVEYGLFDVHGWYNGADKNERESTYEYGKKCIDIFATTSGVMQFINRCKVVEFHEIINTDY